jgi:hypothetical protein
MPQVTGSITLNGITDAQLIKILQVKEKNANFTFNPQQMQTGQINEGGQMKSIYNNVVISWGAGEGLKTVRDLLNDLIGP